MERRMSSWWALPLGLVLGGLAGVVLGALGLVDLTQWMILGAGGGLVLGLAVRTAIESRRGNRERSSGR
jgi:hypothetical protein